MNAETTKPETVVIAVQPIPMVPVESSQIAAIGHDPETNTLAVRFAGKDADTPGALYHYGNFSAADLAAWHGADSVGSHFYKVIKAHPEVFPYVRIPEQKPAA